ncbi:iron-sulfur cluster assembly scaffold protein [Candidatus Gracilibacteria bacterium]|nr:iron-sulfur cluster assembly scaffold protein [Candidatus Gracilibacteria bacterium]
MNSAELIMAYSRDVPNKYIMENPTLRYREVNRVCSDVVEVFLRIENDILTEFSFDGYMSITATACVAITGELLLEHNIDEILTLNEKFIHENIGNDISPRRRLASLIGLLAIKNAIHIYKNDSIREDFSDIEI